MGGFDKMKKKIIFLFIIGASLFVIINFGINILIRNYERKNNPSAVNSPIKNRGKNKIINSNENKGLEQEREEPDTEFPIVNKGPLVY